MNYTLVISGIITIIIAGAIGLQLSESPLPEEDETTTNTTYYAHQFNNVSGSSVEENIFVEGNCDVELAINNFFESEIASFIILENGEEIYNSTENNITTLSLSGNNINITIRVTGGDTYPESDMADYYVVKMVSNCS